MISRIKEFVKKPATRISWVLYIQALLGVRQGCMCTSRSPCPRAASTPSPSSCPGRYFNVRIPTVRRTFADWKCSQACDRKGFDLSGLMRCQFVSFFLGSILILVRWLCQGSANVSWRAGANTRKIRSTASRYIALWCWLFWDPLFSKHNWFVFFSSFQLRPPVRGNKEKCIPELSAFQAWFTLGFRHQRPVTGASVHGPDPQPYTRCRSSGFWLTNPSCSASGIIISTQIREKPIF